MTKGNSRWILMSNTNKQGSGKQTQVPLDGKPERHAVPRQAKKRAKKGTSGEREEIFNEGMKPRHHWWDDFIDIHANRRLLRQRWFNLLPTVEGNIALAIQGHKGNMKSTGGRADIAFMTKYHIAFTARCSVQHVKRTLKRLKEMGRLVIEDKERVFDHEPPHLFQPF